MQVLTHTDNHINGTPELSAKVAGEVESALERFGKQITRVEVHLSDVNSHKRGEGDKRCTMEARISGLDPIAVTEDANSVGAAIAGAAKKLERSVDKTVGRLNDRR